MPSGPGRLRVRATSVAGELFLSGPLVPQTSAAHAAAKSHSRWVPIGVDPATIVLEALTVAKRKQHQIAKRMIGRYIVADPEICHGQPTFRGTRILVADVMEQVAGGVAWETIVEEWRGDVPLDAIAEAVRLKPEDLA